MENSAEEWYQVAVGRGKEVEKVFMWAKIKMCLKF